VLEEERMADIREQLSAHVARLFEERMKDIALN